MLRPFFCLCMLLLSFPSALKAEDRRGVENLAKQLSPLVLETRQLKIPSQKAAHNPSFIPYGAGWLLCFRAPDEMQPQNSHLYIVALNKDFTPLTEPQRLDTGSKTSEDPRLLMCGSQVCLVYGDYASPHMNSLEFRRIWIARLVQQRGRWNVEQATELKDFPGQSKTRNEKNWAPFCYESQLFLSYFIMPHRVFAAVFGNTSCTTFSESPVEIPWQWGQIRGGTPAIFTHGRYLAFFHSAIKMRSVQSKGKAALHYFMGAYTFAPQPPFAIESMSIKPIIGEQFYSVLPVLPQNKYIRVVFPSGLVEDGPYLWVVFGKQDCQMWLAKFNTQQLLDSLMPIAQ